MRKDENSIKAMKVDFQDTSSNTMKQAAAVYEDNGHIFPVIGTAMK